MIEMIVTNSEPDAIPIFAVEIRLPNIVIKDTGIGSA